MATFLAIPDKIGGTPRSFSFRNATEVSFNVYVDYFLFDSYLCIHWFANKKGNLQAVPFTLPGQFCV